VVGLIALNLVNWPRGYGMEGSGPTSATSHPRTMPSPRSIRPSGSVETFWEPGGDLIHYQDGNNRDDIPVRFLVT
jgi:hypothetical protein